MEIAYIDRKTGQKNKEKVYGEGFIHFLYKNTLGQRISPIITNKWFSKLYGRYQNSSWSQRKIDNFVREFNINMSEYLPTEGRSWTRPYGNFNEFFIRRFRKGKRPFANDPNVMPAVAEARYLAFREIQETQLFPVKGKYLSTQALLQHEWAETFRGGPLIIARLCPTDYHRFHFPDNGEVLHQYRLTGEYHSVNPLALQFKNDILCSNERHVTIIQTSHFGKLAYIEVGALCVGKIIQTYNSSRPFNRGDEKGYFLFGGSTVIILGEKGKWIPDTDLLTNTEQHQIETFVRLGEGMAHVQPSSSPTA